MLTNTAISKAKAKDKSYKIRDERGMYLIVTPKGGKWWRVDYRFQKKRKTLSLGVFPDVSLKVARERRDDARRLIASGIDPAEHRKIEKIERHERAANSLETVAREWLAKQANKWSPAHTTRNIKRLENHLFPWIGSKPISEVSAPDLLACLRRIEDRGAPDMAHRVRQIAGAVFRYGIATGRCERDVAADLRGALESHVKQHHATITEPQAIGQLLRDIDETQGTFVVCQALKFSPLVFVRPGELRKAEWSEINLEKAEWRIPASKMKMKAIHIVPLSKQAIEILRDIYPLTGKGQFVFPSVRTNKRPMSDNTINVALRRIGYDKKTMTGHGFRSMASTLLNEQGFNRDWIERQLAHAERDESRAAYNHAEYLQERKGMMQSWADYLDSLKQDTNIV